MALTLSQKMVQPQKVGVKLGPKAVKETKHPTESHHMLLLRVKTHSSQHGDSSIRRVTHCLTTQKTKGWQFTHGQEALDLDAQGLEVHVAWILFHVLLVWNFG